jgi:succinate dehydrogenase/fumarate reductase flavoprotein subunit
LEAHFHDTIKGGQWLNDQELAWKMVKEAPGRILELENRAGCFFDRNPDGTVNQKPFAGQSFDRTVHKGDLTGIEIINRLSEQVAAMENVTIREEMRAVDLLFDRSGQKVTGALLIDLRCGEFIVVQARAVLLATGGGPTMYKITAPCQDKTCDGIAMGFRAGATLMDMEMVQFHPTGLLAGNSMISGTVLEEGLRGAGAYLINGKGERYMHRYDPREERATRDVVSRSSFMEIMAGRGTPEGGIYLDASHLGAEFVMKNFRGMSLRCKDVGYDLPNTPVIVSPTAHFIMGGLRIEPDCRTDLEGLFAAGEDAAGVHGANRLGGNGVAESTVFGGIAGDVIADYLAGQHSKPVQESQIRKMIESILEPFERKPSVSIYSLRDRCKQSMWENAGLVRNEDSLQKAADDMNEIREQLSTISLTQGGRAFHLEWMEYLSILNYLDVCDVIIRSAQTRKESRGSHFRSDFPDKENNQPLYNICCSMNQKLQLSPVLMTRMKTDVSESV